MPFQAQRFWNHKIENWESKRYEKPDAPIARRAAFAREFLNQSAKDQRVLDIGCGSGVLFEGLDAKQFKSLHGVDFSEAAIARARSKDFAPNVTFGVALAGEIDVREYDFVVALGLLDWLNESDLALLLNRLSGRRFLLSFSNSSSWRMAMLHAAFVQITYGWRTSGYRPRYFHAQELLFHFHEKALKDIRFTTLPGHSLVGFLMST